MHKHGLFKFSGNNGFVRRAKISTDFERRILFQNHRGRFFVMHARERRDNFL